MSQRFKKGLVFEFHGNFIHEKISTLSRGTFRADFKSEDISAVNVRTASEKGR